MTISFPCGCTFDEYPETVGIEYQTEECTSEGFVDAIAFAEYCKPCADRVIKEWGAKITQYDENGKLIDQWKAGDN